MNDYDTTIQIEKIVRDDLRNLKGKEENYCDFIRSLYGYVTGTQKRYQEWNEWRRNQGCYYEPTNFSVDKISSPY